MSQQINLYNPAFIPKRELLTGQNLAAAALLLCLSLAAAGYWAATQARQKAAEAATAAAQLKQAQDARDALVKAAQARKPSAALQAEIDQTRRLLEMRGEVLALLSGAIGKGGGNGGAGFADYLTGLARQTREGLWLTGFSVGSGSGSMNLSGRTVDKARLGDYIRRLNNEPAFAGKSFAGLQMDYREIPTGGGANSTVPPAPTSAAKDGLPPRFVEFRLVAESAAKAGAKP